MSFSISPGTSLEALQQAMGQRPAEAEAAPAPRPQLQQDTEQQPAMKRARVKGKFRADDPATPEDEAWAQES